MAQKTHPRNENDQNDFDHNDRFDEGEEHGERPLNEGCEGPNAECGANSGAATVPLPSGNGHVIPLFEEGYNDKILLHEGQLDNWKAYLESGEATDIDKGYKTSIRDQWWVIPSIKLSDALFLRRNNLNPKFVQNEADAYLNT